MPDSRCLNCLNEITERAISLSTNDIEQQAKLISKLVKYTEENFANIKLPDFSTEIFKIIAEQTGISDPFLDIKQKSNEYFQKLVPKIVDSMIGLKEKKRTYLLFMYSIAANMVDFSTGGHSVDIEGIASKIFHFPDEGLAIDDFQKLYDSINKAEKIIYLSDNCGEVVIDNLVVEFLKKVLNKKVYLGLKGGPVANDCTIKDFERDGLPFNATETFIVSSSFGYNLEETTKKFKQLLKNADLLIVKGQSNYETTLNNLVRHKDFHYPPIFCLLRTKCEVITKHLGVPLGSNVIKQMYPSTGKTNIKEIIDCIG
ncbi:MAG: DUF89 family protein [Candidatus Heimdallarchaeota archaeon]|nr:DUF89 family protein [Candidatus Heimdallarchaeota archaeon]